VYVIRDGRNGYKKKSNNSSHTSPTGGITHMCQSMRFRTALWSLT
jgi:hypothetical protein